MKFVDEVKLKIAAGKGGDGMIAFRREAHVDRGGPDGGDGGNGGSIYFVPDSGTNTLLHLYLKKIIKAEDGENGRRKNQYGANGNDLYIKVPKGTLVYEGTKLICDILEDRPYLIAQGGKGGRGNTKFKTSRNTAPKIAERGDKGQVINATLNLKIMADIGFVGKPSAGKSTLLAAVSNAKPKIAEYSFTTLVPQLGLLKYYDHSYVVADLPGLIKGASQGKGLGIQFLKHIERCRLIAHILDMGSENKDPIHDFEEINNELRSYNLDLELKKQIVVANKSDLPLFEEHLTKFQKKYPNIEIISISALNKTDIDKLKEIFWNEIKNIQAPVIEKINPEITVTLEEYFEVKKIFEGSYEILGPQVEKIYNKIPIISHDNLMLFNYQLKKIGVWKELEKQGVKKGDLVRILDYEFEWE